MHDADYSLTVPLNHQAPLGLVFQHPKLHMELFLIVATIVAAVILVIGLIDPQDIYVASNSPTRARVTAIYGSATLALAIAYLTANPEFLRSLQPDPVSRAQSEIKELSPHVADVNLLAYPNGGYELNFLYTHTADDRAEQAHEYLATQSMELIKKAGAILAENEIPLRFIVLKVNATKDDKFGNPVTPEVFTITIGSEIITKINWKNIKPAGLMELVAVTFTKEGLSMMRDACPAAPAPTYFCVQLKRQLYIPR